MRTHSIPSYYRNQSDFYYASYLALLSTLMGLNYPCFELILMVPKVFEPLKFYYCYNKIAQCMDIYERKYSDIKK